MKFIKEIVENKIQIKASGGIRNRDEALSFIESGANRIGTSSGVKIVSE